MLDDTGNSQRRAVLDIQFATQLDRDGLPYASLCAGAEGRGVDYAGQHGVRYA